MNQFDHHAMVRSLEDAFASAIEIEALISELLKIIVPNTVLYHARRQLTYCPHVQAIHTKVSAVEMTGPYSPMPRPIVP